MPRKLCSVQDCNELHYSKGFCRVHYQRNRRNGDPLLSNARQKPACSVKGCTNPAHGKGLCRNHYGRMLKWGCPYFIAPSGGMRNSRGRPKGSYFYSDADLMKAYRAGDTEVSFTARTGIAHQTVSIRYGRFNRFKELAKEYQARRAACIK